MESSCCHGNSKRSGQAQACAENGLIGKGTGDWGLNHKGLPAPRLTRLRVSARGGRRSRARTQHRGAQLRLPLPAPLPARGSVLGDAEEGGAAEPKSRRRAEARCF